MSKQSNKLTPKQTEILSAYVKNSVKLKRYLSRGEMRDLGFSRDSIRGAFNSLEGLKAAAKKLYSKELSSITEERLHAPQKKERLVQDLKKYNRFVITTAVEGAPVDRRFLETIEGYCKFNNAKLLILPVGKDFTEMDPFIADKNIIFGDTALNSNLWISSIQINPRSSNPLTSLSEIGQRDGSLIIGSPKQFLEFVPVGPEKYGHAIMSTGAVTQPGYVSKGGFVKRSDYLANHQHKMGAVIVEIEDNSAFHFTQIQADRWGAFYDRGYRYKGYAKRGIVKTPSSPVAMLWGDLHAGEVDPHAKKASMEQTKLLRPKYVLHGDAFSGISINHHEEHHFVNRALLAEENKMNLRDEIEELCKELDDVTSIPSVEKVYIIASNHHDFLSEQYLQKGKYVHDHQNFKLAHKLVDAMMEKHDPLQYACEKIVGLKHPEKIVWLKRDQDLKIGGVQMGAHGDKGANGSKGSKRTLSNAYGRVMHGHTHAPYIWKDVYCVGTNQVLRPKFVKGASSWTHSNGFVYENGMVQLINSFKGNWRIK